MNEKLRIELNEFIRLNGSTNTFIAKSIGVSQTLINFFRKGSRNLGEANLLKLKSFLKER